MGAGNDFQRPMCMMLGTDKLAARAIVGPDIRIECVLNHIALSPKWVADDLTAVWICEYNKQDKWPRTRKDKNGSVSNLIECLDHV